MRAIKAAIIAGSVLVGGASIYGLAKWDQARATEALNKQRFEALERAVVALKRIDASLKQYASEPDATGLESPIILNADLTDTDSNGKSAQRNKREVELYKSAKGVLDQTIQALRELRNGGALTPDFVGEVMTKAGALREYSDIYNLMNKIRETGWQAENGPMSVANIREKLNKLKQSAPDYSYVDGVCSQAFGQEQGKVLLNCMDMRLARQVVLMVEPGQYSRSSYPLNGKFPVIDRGVKQYTITHANAFNSWQSTEMIPTFEVVSRREIDEGERRLAEAERSAGYALQKTNDAISLLHEMLKTYGVGGEGRSASGTEGRYKGYSSLMEEIKYAANNDVDFGNMTFPIGEDSKISLKNGEFSDSDGGATYRFSEAKKFDLNGDGQEDYAVTVVVNYGGMMDDSLQYVVVREGGKVRVIDLGYSLASASEIEVSNGKVTIWPLAYKDSSFETVGEERDWSLKRLPADKSTKFTWKNFQLEKSGYNG